MLSRELALVDGAPALGEGVLPAGAVLPGGAALPIGAALPAGVQRGGSAITAAGASLAFTGADSRWLIALVLALLLEGGLALRRGQGATSRIRGGDGLRR